LDPNDWLPSLISIAVVIIGGFITYQSTFRLERQKRRYELKKEVYFNTLNIIVKLRRELERRRKAAEMAKEIGPQNKAIDDADKELEELVYALKLIQLELRISASPEINKHFEDAIENILNADNFKSFNATVDNELIPAMQRDLARHKSWQFWK
jgi:mevalonate kinase